MVSDKSKKVHTFAEENIILHRVSGKNSTVLDEYLSEIL